MASCLGYANGCGCGSCGQWSATLPRRLSSDKDVRKEMEILNKLGFVYTGPNGAGKHCFEHQGEPFLTTAEPWEIALAPSPKGAWRRKHRHRLARLMGLSQWQLDRVIAGQPIEAVKREPRPGRKTNEAVVMEHAMALGIPCTKQQATRLIGRYGGTKNARKALNGMARVADRVATAA